MKKTLLVAAALALASAASAANNNFQLNIYGASAQFDLWSTQAADLLVDTAAGIGCTATASATNSYSVPNVGTVKYWAQWCTAPAGNNSAVRVVAYNSIEGVKSVTAGTTDPDPTAPVCGAGQRKFLNNAGALACMTPTLGAADVESASFIQQGFGLDGTDYSVSPVAGAPANPASFVNVPFAFYVNNSVATPAAMTNITKLQAALIYAGTVQNWNQFGAGYPNLQILACMRRPGSGTHASLDGSVMNGTGLSINPFEDKLNVWFNLATGDEQTCIGRTVSGDGTNTPVGAIGYTDADKAAPANTTKLTFNGSAATARNVARGQYDFWSTGKLYGTIPTEFATYMGNPNSVFVQAGVPNSKGPYWVLPCESNVDKATAFSLPIWKAATCGPRVAPLSPL